MSMDIHWGVGVMAGSRKSILAMSAVFGGIAALAAVTMSPAVAGSNEAAISPEGGCTATANIESQWGSGQIVTFTVTNTSSAATRRWTVTWPLAAGQRVVSAWNGTVSTSGGIATAVNAPYNGDLAPGASTAFGMQLSGTGPAPAAACDNGASTPPTSPPPGGGADVSVGEADSQKTVTLVVGQTLGVSLGADFLKPAVSGTALAQVSASGGYPGGQPLAALYRAVSPGSVDVTTHSDYSCLHATPPCAVPIRLWTVHVNVVAAGPTVVVTAADNQKSVRLHVGDTLVVSLASNYLPPKLSAAGVLDQSDVTGGYPTGQPLVARFVAVAAGAVGVSTLTDAACNHEPTPCPSPQVPWAITVAVTA
jgi:cellulose binding protein with CBM2 domain